MLIRRCKVVYLEPREQARFDLGVLFAGGSGVRRTRSWFALAPHLGAEYEVGDEERGLLGDLSPEEWVEDVSIPVASRAALEFLLRTGLVVCDSQHYAHHRDRDDALRASHWHPLSALVHGLTRWGDVDTVDAMQKTGTETAAQLRGVLGAPPPERVLRRESGNAMQLPRAGHGEFDRLLQRRATCRNFDRTRPLPLHLFSQVLDRVFAAQGSVRVTEDTVFLKKNSPSGGGLHPVDAYLLVRDVEDVVPGIYHYDALEHALRPMPSPSLALDDFTLRALAGQDWFSGAHAMAIMAPRYARNFWKYRQHAKAYRAVLLEAGHLSQTLYLSATEAGLAAYVTCAINEACLDEALGLDPLNEGVLAICGFGWRGETMETMELDPIGAVWPPG